MPESDTSPLALERLPRVDERVERYIRGCPDTKGSVKPKELKRELGITGAQASHSLARLERKAGSSVGAKHEGRYSWWEVV